MRFLPGSTKVSLTLSFELAQRVLVTQTIFAGGINVDPCRVSAVALERHSSQRATRCPMMDNLDVSDILLRGSQLRYVFCRVIHHLVSISRYVSLGRRIC